MLHVQRGNSYIVVPDHFSVEVSEDSVFDSPELYRKLWPSSFGGGIIEYNAESLSWARQNILGYLLRGSISAPIGGTSLGNEAAFMIRDDVSLIEPYRLPGSAVRFGLGKNFKCPTVAITPEHVDGMGESKVLIIKFQKKLNRESLDAVLQRIDDYGIKVKVCGDQLRDDIKHATSTWFSSSQHELSFWELTSPSDSAIWNWAIIAFAGISAQLNVGKGLN
jgi:hypothetical protein